MEFRIRNLGFAVIPIKHPYPGPKKKDLALGYNNN